MWSKQRDLASAGIIAAIGLITIIASLEYNMGTVRNMGPGYFPMILGVLLMIFSVGIVVFDVLFKRPSHDPEASSKSKINWRSLIALSAAIVLFALTIDRLGLAPAIFLTVYISCQADSKISQFKACVLAGCMSIFCILVFKLGLGLQVEVFDL